MTDLLERYDFNWNRIQKEDSFNIEYCITDICNRSCAHCSHLAPLAKNPSFVGTEEFAQVLGIMQKLIPQAHTVWLTGGGGADFAP